MSKNVSIVEVSPNVTVLVSYATPVAAEVNGKFLATSTFYSRTTTRHISEWLQNKTASMVEQAFLDKLLA